MHLKFMNEVGLAEQMFYYEFHGISHRDIEFNFNTCIIIILYVRKIIMRFFRTFWNNLYHSRIKKEMVQIDEGHDHEKWYE